MKQPLTLALCCAAMPALAAPEGCYTRHYSADHLAEHPAQVVANLWVAFERDAETDARSARMGVTTASGGHVAGTDQADAFFPQWLVCDASEDPFWCAVECDGGMFEVVRDTFESVDIRTEYLTVGTRGSCGGAVDIAEATGTGAPTTYRLFRSPPDGCQAP